MRMGWLKVSDGSTGALTPAEEDPGRRARKALGLDGKAGERPQSVALQRRSGGAGLPVLDGKHDRDGRATGPGRSARVKGPTGPLGTLGQPFPQCGA